MKYCNNNVNFVSRFLGPFWVKFFPLQSISIVSILVKRDQDVLYLPECTATTMIAALAHFKNYHIHLSAVVGSDEGAG